jgi:ABC-type dipeptide/oligopeptide/nickel transport system permease subunit
MIEKTEINAAPPSAEPTVFAGFRSRYLRHPGFMTGLVILILTSMVAIAAPWISPYPPLETDMMRTLEQPSLEHLLGTDQFGRDVLSRLLAGARVSLEVAFMVVVISLTFGTVIGAIAGYAGGWIERCIMIGNDIMLAFPGFLLALALVAARGSSLESVIIAVSIAYMPRVAAVMRSVVLTIKPRPYIEYVARARSFRSCYSEQSTAGDRGCHGECSDCDFSGSGLELSRPWRPATDGNLGKRYL